MENPDEIFLSAIEAEKIIDNRYVDPIRIDNVGGDGHHSLVFVAKDKQSKKNREVALKFISPRFSDDLDKASFFDREVKMLEALRGQKNILPLIQGKGTLVLKLETQFGSFPYRLPFYVSYKADFSAKKYIIGEGGANNFLRNILLFRDMCKAVQRIHNNRIIHRDIKPGNFLVYRIRGQLYACLSDFGSARYFNEEEYKPVKNTTYDHVPRGDKTYQSPEVFCSVHFDDNIGCYSDIYALGSILFELFTKTTLGEEIFRDRVIIEDLSGHFITVLRKDRRIVFDDFIGGFEDGIFLRI